MKRILVGSLIMLLFSFGCGGGGGDSESDDGDLTSDTISDTTSDTVASGNEATISFTVLSSQLSSSSSYSSLSKAISSEDLTPNELIYIDLTKESLEFTVVSLSEGLNEVTVSKDGVYLFGLVYNPNSDTDGIADIDYIELIGNICISTYNLDTLPIDEAASDEINLGELVLDESRYVSDVSESVINEFLGYDSDQMYNYGLYDNTFRLYLNPDINHNGVYDFEEGISWRFSDVSYFLWDASAIDNFKNGNYSAILDEMQYKYWFAYNIDIFMDPIVGAGDAAMIFYEVDGEYAPLGSIDDINFDHTLEMDDVSAQYRFGTWDCDESDEGPTVDFNGDLGPWDGNYKIEDGDYVYFFRNLAFPTPTNDLVRFFFPFYYPEDTDGDDSYDLLTYKWMAKEGDTLVEISSDELELARVFLPNCSIEDRRSGQLDNVWVQEFTSLESSGSIVLEPQVPIEGHQTGEWQIHVGYWTYGFISSFGEWFQRPY